MTEYEGKPITFNWNADAPEPAPHNPYSVVLKPMTVTFTPKEDVKTIVLTLNEMHSGVSIDMLLTEQLLEVMIAMFQKALAQIRED